MSLKELGTILFPPDVPAVIKWRLAVFATIIVIVAHAMWGHGWLSGIGLGDGYAYADSLKSVRADVSQIQAALTEQRIFDLRIRQCEADTQEQKRFYTQRVQELMNEYRAITGTEYRLPACEEL